MHQLVPPFILEKHAAGEANGRFPAVVIFFDTSGFTPLTTQLMQYGKEGAEYIADALALIFEPQVQTIYENGGFIAGFAGDAFKAIFPLEQPEAVQRAVVAAWQIRQQVASSSQFPTRFGTFTFAGKLCVALGTVEWGIWRGNASQSDSQQAAYFFEGEALTRALQADPHATAGDLLVTQDILEKVAHWHPVTSEIDNYYVIKKLTIDDWQLTIVNNSPFRTSDTNFYPITLQTQTTKGEFRRVISLFINLQTLPQTAAFQQTLFRLVNQYGGYLCRIGRIGDKDGGGTLLLFWGAPTGHEDDTQRALRFALDLREAAPTPVRIGITSGMAYAGFIGAPQREEYTCHGSVVNAAARQMVLADWGDILLDEETARLADPQLAIEAAGKRPFKGFAQPRPVFRLLQEQVAAPQTAYGTRFAGRESELLRLREALQPLSNGRFGGVVGIIGEAGIGKSRLVHEFEQILLTERPFPFRWLLGQTQVIVRPSLNPFRYLLHHAFGQDAQASEATNRTTFEQLWQELIEKTTDSTLQAELTRVRSFIGAMLNLHWPDSLYEKVEPELRFQNRMAALKTVLIALARQQPLILQLEDAHWFDDDSRQFLKQLTQNITHVPLLLLLTSRIELDESWFATGTPLQTIDLSTLPTVALRQMAQGLLQQPVADALIAELESHTAGNPFFAEQQLLYWQENGLLEPSGTGLVVRDTETAVPGDVRAVLVARLDRLMGKVKEVVQTAAVLGREFELQVLSQMLHGEGNLSQQVQQATDEAIWLAMNEVRYIFRHALLRDAAYEMQLNTRLRALHQLAATAMQQLYAADLAPHAADLAYHYDRAEQRETAVHWYTIAAQQAAAQFANRDVLDYVRQALSLLADEEKAQRYELLILRAKVYSLMAQRQEQRQDLEAALLLAETLADLEKTAVAALQLAIYHEMVGDYDDAIAQADRVIALAEQLGSPYFAAKSRIYKAKSLWPPGNYDAAAENLQTALELAEAHSLLETKADALRSMGILADTRGQYTAAMPFHHQSLEAYRQLDDLEGQGATLSNIGMTYLKMANYDDGQRYLVDGLTLMKRIGHRQHANSTLGNLGIINMRRGRYTEARAYFEQVREAFLEIGDRWAEAMAWYYLGITKTAVASYATANEELLEGLRRFRAINSRDGEAMMLNGLGVNSLLSGQLALAEQQFVESDQLYRDVGNQQLVARIMARQGWLALWQAELARAKERANSAVALCDEIGEQQAKGFGLLVLGQVAEAERDWGEAAVFFQSAFDLHTELGEPHYALEAQAGLARIEHMQWRKTAALQAIIPILTHLRTGTLDGTHDRMLVRLTCIRILRASRDPRASTQLRMAQRKLQQLAGQFEGENGRLAFLQNVPSHQELAKMSL